MGTSYNRAIIHKILDNPEKFSKVIPRRVLNAIITSVGIQYEDEILKSDVLTILNQITGVVKKDTVNTSLERCIGTFDMSNSLSKEERVANARHIVRCLSTLPAPSGGQAWKLKQIESSFKFVVECEKYPERFAKVISDPRNKFKVSPYSGGCGGGDLKSFDILDLYYIAISVDEKFTAAFLNWDSSECDISFCVRILNNSSRWTVIDGDDKYDTAESLTESVAKYEPYASSIVAALRDGKGVNAFMPVRRNSDAVVLTAIAFGIDISTVSKYPILEFENLINGGVIGITSGISSYEDDLARICKYTFGEENFPLSISLNHRITRPEYMPLYSAKQIETVLLNEGFDLKAASTNFTMIYGHHEKIESAVEPFLNSPNYEEFKSPEDALNHLKGVCNVVIGYHPLAKNTESCHSFESLLEGAKSQEDLISFVYENESRAYVFLKGDIMQTFSACPEFRLSFSEEHQNIYLSRQLVSKLQMICPALKYEIRNAKNKNKVIDETITKFKNNFSNKFSDDEKLKYASFFKSVMNIGMYMRGWKRGDDDFPLKLSQTFALKKEAEDEIENNVSVEVSNLMSEFNDDENVKNLNMCGYSSKNGEFIPLAGTLRHASIIDRMKMISKTDDVGGCIRLASNEFIISGYYFLVMVMGLQPPPFNISVYEDIY